MKDNNNFMERLWRVTDLDNNNYIRCKECGCITGIKLQIGSQAQHPIVVTCGKCGNSMKGKVSIDHANAGFKLEFENADVIDAASADYTVECSGEFPTKKSCEVTDADKMISSPLDSVKNCMKSEQYYEQFAQTIAQLKETESKWGKYRKIFELSQNNSPELISEIQKEFKGPHFQCRNRHETIRAVHMVELLGFYTSIRKDILQNMQFSNDILKLNSKQMKDFIGYLNSHDGYHLDELQSVIYRIYDEFMEIYQNLIPALSLQYCKEDAFDFEEDGTTASTLDSVKQFYIDVYEALGTLMIIPVAFNNIKYRSDYSAMNPVKDSVKSLDDFIGLDKAERYNFCIDSEEYTRFLDVKTNANLRSALESNDFEYDSFKQMITYALTDKTEKSTEYLLEMEDEAMCMFQAILGISEYMYRMNEAILIFGM